MRKEEAAFGSPVDVGVFRVTPIVRSRCRVESGEEGAWGSGGVEPLGVVVDGPEGSFALALDGSPLPFVEG